MTMKQEPVQEHKQEPTQEHKQVEKVPVEENPQDISQQITSDVPKTRPMKNPGRVAAGKTLAARNKTNREEKKQKQQGKNVTKKSQHEQVQHESQQSMSGFYLISIAGFLVSLLGLYYKRQEVLTMLKAAKSEEKVIKKVPMKEEQEESQLVNMD